MERIDIAIDFGGSGVKAVASCNESVVAFRVGPQVIDILDAKYLEQEFSIDLARNLWVKTDDVAYAVGDLAAAQYYAPIPMVDPKSAYVLPRTLGAVAVAAHKLGIKKSFKIALQLLLPAEEFEQEDKIKLMEDLKLALAEFDTSIGPIKVKLIGYTAKPEGFGLMRRRLELAGTDTQEQGVAVVMLGHRNTSLYLSAGGSPRHFRSNNIGFIRAIEHAKVSQTRAIADPSLVDPDSLAQYWNANKRWFREHWPEGATSVIVGGGPMAAIGSEVVKYLESLLQASKSRRKVFLNGGMPLNRYEERNGAIDNDPNRPLLSQWPEGLGISDDDKLQFCDVYCFWATREQRKK